MKRWLAPLLFVFACARGAGGGDPEPDPRVIEPSGPCQGRSCQKVVCTSGTPTRLTGRVTDPRGRNGIYNVGVYVPNFEPKPIPHGARCDACATRDVRAAATTLTDVRGEFVLDDVPVGKAVPVVVEIGRFRRITVVDTEACTERRLDEATTRLPRNRDEGELPTIAVTTGAADALECLLRNIGIDETEFGRGGEAARVQVFAGRGGGGVGPATPAASTLWNDPATLALYDVVALSCEGDPADETKGDKSALAAYVNGGGHVFATHFHSTWLETSPDPSFRAVASWAPIPDDANEYTIDTSFPKGRAFSEWLSVVGATDTPGVIRLDNVTFSAGAISSSARGWLRRGDQVRYFSFNAPVGAARENQCGRFVFSDVHALGLGGSDFPGSCPPADQPLTPQQLALEFLLFDLFSCVDDDARAPEPPR